MPHGPNHRTAESSSLVEGGSTVAGTYDSLPQASQQVTSDIVTHDVTHDCDLWDSEHYVTSLSGHFDYLENNAKVFTSSILCIACFIQKHPIGSCPIEQFSPILGAGSIM